MLCGVFEALDPFDVRTGVSELLFIMANIASSSPVEWRRTISSTSYFISSAHDLISPSFVNDAFADASMPWAYAFAESDLQTLMKNSVILGVYTTRDAKPDTVTSNTMNAQASELEQVGMARFITDRLTVFYITDVFIAPAHRGRGIGGWMADCMRDIMDGMPHLKRAMLMATPGSDENPFESKSISFYKERLNMEVFDQGRGVVAMCRSKAWWDEPENKGRWT